MKTVYVTRDFDYRAHPRRLVRFAAGVTYSRVIERAAQAIENAGAGRILLASSAGNSIDASGAFRPPRKRRL